jgi:integrase/recombinase XerD
VKMSISLDVSRLQELFIEERRYLKSVSPRTLVWYRSSFKAFGSDLDTVTAESDLKPRAREGVIRMLDAGVLPVSVNSYCRCLNAFFRWLHVEGHIVEPLKLSKLPQEKKTVPVLTQDEARRLIAANPHQVGQRRAHIVALLILDTGLRINEALNVQKDDVDFDNLLISVRMGKGRKQRIVPFSLQLRKFLFKFVSSRSHPNSPYVFTTNVGTVVSQRNASRDLKKLGRNVGIPRVRFHLLRHHFATTYLRTGGSVALLRKILGHSSILTTQIYEHCQTEDLTAVHHSHSALATTR